MTASDCPSTLALERLLLAELDAESAGLRKHVATCGRCSKRLSDMEAQAASFSRSPHSSSARRRFEQADRRWRYRAMAFAVAPAVVVAALAVLPLNLFGSPEIVHAQLPPQAPAARHARDVVELRPTTVAPQLRRIALHGEGVELGQGTLEGSGPDGTARPFVLKHTSVEADVLGFVSTVIVTQEFENPFSAPTEAVYVFPLPDNAAVDQMTLTAGNRVIRASIQKREVARRMYEEAKSQGRRAALLDQERPNIFTQSVANLLPGEKVKVSLRYSAPLKYDGGEYTFNFPMVVGPRYVPGEALPGAQQGTGTSADTTRVLDASRITPPAERTGRDIDVIVRLDAGNPVEALYSTSHRLVAERESSQRLVIALDASDRIPNKDLILKWRVAGQSQRATMLASGGSGGTFALMVVPPAPDVKAEVIPREMVFVIDTSCSMSGPPLAAAKKAMHLALEQMNPDDTFMLIDFASTASTFHDAPLPNTPANVGRALAYLEALPAGGGTNQLVGLEKALNRPKDSRRLRTVLLMTDGYIGNEQEIFGRVQQVIGDARLFGFGVGTSVNHYFLERLSELGRGYAQTIRPDQDSAPVIGQFIGRLSKPLLTDIEIDWGGLAISDVQPGRIPDLFDAQPLVVLGRYQAAQKGSFMVRGLVNGRKTELRVDVEFPTTETGAGPGLKAMWARARIEALERQQYGIEKAEQVRQITTLGLEYHLVTAYTSLVATEDVAVAAAGNTSSVTVPTEVPQLTETTTDGRLSANTSPVIPKPVVTHRPASGYKDSTLGFGGDGAENGSVGGAVGGEIRGHVAQGPALKDPPAHVSLPVAGTDQHDGDDDFASAFGSHGSGEGQGAGGLGSIGTGRGGGGTGGIPPPRKADPNTAATFGTNLGGQDKGTVGNKSVYIPPAPGSADQVKDSLGTSDIMEGVLAHKGELAKCAEEQHLREPGVHGKLVVKWTIGLNGRVLSITIVTTELEKTYMAACVMRSMKTWTFPRTTVLSDPVTFPFKF